MKEQFWCFGLQADVLHSVCKGEKDTHSQKSLKGMENHV